MKGLLKVNWNLKKPIQLISEAVIPINFKSIDSLDHENVSNLHENTKIKVIN